VSGRARPAWARPLGVVDRPFPVRVLAPNPGPFTLEGTNTWIVGRGPTLVIDPGPDDAAHLEAVLREAADVAAILLTHRHPDHAPGGAALASTSGAPVLAFAPQPGQTPLADGEVIQAGGVRLRTMHTPGHTRDHVVFVDADAGIVFTGDMVLGRGTSVIDPPDGDLADYLRSLDSLLAVGPSVLCPGHGPVVWDARAKVREYLAHRGEREHQVLEALQAGPSTPEDLVPRIYADYPPEIHPAAARSVLAHLLKLEREGRAVRREGGLDRFALPGGGSRPKRQRRSASGKGTPAADPGPAGTDATT
jgi:glyoxylase-like metal-dependent hydrolase (beta-lactamase superfamily II)